MTAKRTVRMRLLRDDPAAPSGDASAPFGLQDKDENLQPPIKRADGMHVFDFELTVSEGPDGRPNFTGPFACGPRDQRFVYLSWPRTDGCGYVNRIKVRLTDLDWRLVNAAIERGVPLEADASGRKAGGGTVPAQWRFGEG
uniref:DUF5990 family protein n=1 Tax=Altererythrobacter segetis TaxID=1104773 RepID=UPI0014091F0D|nr:DUF5990 family protein [Altererythrobacter segetis]